MPIYPVVTKNIGREFQAVKAALSRTFLPTPFEDDCDNDDKRRDISFLPVKWAGLAVPNPTLVADANCDASTLTCSHMSWPRFEDSSACY
jgi:hypothetical protein